MIPMYCVAELSTEVSVLTSKSPIVKFLSSSATGVHTTLPRAPTWTASCVANKAGELNTATVSSNKLSLPC